MKVLEVKNKLPEGRVGAPLLGLKVAKFSAGGDDSGKVGEGRRSSCVFAGVGTLCAPSSWCLKLVTMMPGLKDVGTDICVRVEIGSAEHR